MTVIVWLAVPVSTRADAEALLDHLLRVSALRANGKMMRAIVTDGDMPGRSGFEERKLP